MPSTRTLALALVAGLSLAACSGGAMGTNSGTATSALPVTGSAATGASKSAHATNTNALAISDFNSFGSDVKDLQETTNSKPGGATCNNGIESFYPDLAGTPNSTEVQYFYNSACTELANDVVRVWAPGSTVFSETVNVTNTSYAPNNSTPISVKTSTQYYSNSTFDYFGNPSYTNGYRLHQNGTLTIGTVKKALSDSEQVVLPSLSNVNNYCGDGASYNTKIVGMAGVVFASVSNNLSGNATRTVNPDGSVTWSSTNAGAQYTGAPGVFSINTGTYNTSCPISTPAYTLSGGSFKGDYSLPTTTTVSNGLIVNMAVTNGTRVTGNTLNVTTNSYVPPSSTNFIYGVTAEPGGAQVSTFSVNAWGNGTLTVTKTGNSFTITDWFVIN
jgi:hypothetical protein